MKKYVYQLQTIDMEERKKMLIIELEDDEFPTAKTIIRKRLIEAMKPNNILEIGDILSLATKMLEKLIYFEIKEVKKWKD
jgi:hypothetical protein